MIAEKDIIREAPAYARELNGEEKMTQNVREKATEVTEIWAKFSPWLWWSGLFTSSEMRVYITLCCWRDWDSNECWPSQKTIAEVSKVSVRHTQRCLKALEKKGVIRTLSTGRGRGIRNVYQILDLENVDSILENNLETVDQLKKGHLLEKRRQHLEKRRRFCR